MQLVVMSYRILGAKANPTFHSATAVVDTILTHAVWANMLAVVVVVYQRFEVVEVPAEEVTTLVSYQHWRISG
jgi:hypothetical protein